MKNDSSYWCNSTTAKLKATWRDRYIHNATVVTSHVRWCPWSPVCRCLKRRAGGKWRKWSPISESSSSSSLIGKWGFPQSSLKHRSANSASKSKPKFLFNLILFHVFVISTRKSQCECENVGYPARHSCLASLIEKNNPWYAAETLQAEQHCVVLLVVSL